MMRMDNTSSQKNDGHLYLLVSHDSSLTALLGSQ